MKKVPVLLLVFFLLSLNLLAQASEIRVEMRDEEDNIHLSSLPDYVGIKGNGGPMVGMIQLDLKEMNKILEEMGFSLMDEEMILIGGGGVGGVKRGIRVGGIGMTGNTKSYNENNDRIILDVNYGGFLFEQGIAASPKADLGIGGLIGGGVMEMNRVERFSGNFSDSLKDSHSTSLKKEFIFIKPTISLHLQIMSFIGLTISGGYFLGYDMGADWNFFGTSIPGPLDILQGPTASIRLSFGF